jgi:hypothetical protein
LSIPAYDFRERDITNEIFEAARNVDEGDPAWSSGEPLTVDFEIRPHYTKVGDMKVKGRHVTYRVEFRNRNLESTTVLEEEERKE